MKTIQELKGDIRERWFTRMVKPKYSEAEADVTSLLLAIKELETKVAVLEKDLVVQRQRTKDFLSEVQMLSVKWSC